MIPLHTVLIDPNEPPLGSIEYETDGEWMISSPSPFLRGVKNAAMGTVGAALLLLIVWCLA